MANPPQAAYPFDIRFVAVHLGFLCFIAFILSLFSAQNRDRDLAIIAHEPPVFAKIVKITEQNSGRSTIISYMLSFQNSGQSCQYNFRSRYYIKYDDSVFWQEGDQIQIWPRSDNCKNIIVEGDLQTNNPEIVRIISILGMIIALCVACKTPILHFLQRRGLA